MNIAFAGLTAAGKTTHARRLAAELGYDYVSATEILLEILGINESSEQIWFTRLEEIQIARGGDAVDAELEQRLITLSRTRRRVVFDTWALAWIGDSPMIRIWIESDLQSRIRKCIVSQRSEQAGPAACEALIRDKDDFNRSMFLRRHGFDLFADRHRYDAVLCNSHLIPEATTAAASSGIETFAPIVRSAATSVLRADHRGMRILQQRYPNEVLRIAPSGYCASSDL